MGIFFWGMSVVDPIIVYKMGSQRASEETLLHPMDFTASLVMEHSPAPSPTVSTALTHRRHSIAAHNGNELQYQQSHYNRIPVDRVKSLELESSVCNTSQKRRTSFCCPVEPGSKAPPRKRRLSICDDNLEDQYIHNEDGSISSSMRYHTDTVEGHPGYGGLRRGSLPNFLTTQQNSQPLQNANQFGANTSYSNPFYGNGFHTARPMERGVSHPMRHSPLTTSYPAPRSYVQNQYVPHRNSPVSPNDSPFYEPYSGGMRQNTNPFYQESPVNNPSSDVMYTDSGDISYQNEIHYVNPPSPNEASLYSDSKQHYQDSPNYHEQPPNNRQVSSPYANSVNSIQEPFASQQIPQDSSLFANQIALPEMPSVDYSSGGTNSPIDNDASNSMNEFPLAGRNLDYIQQSPGGEVSRNIDVRESTVKEKDEKKKGFKWTNVTASVTQRYAKDVNESKDRPRNTNTELSNVSQSKDAVNRLVGRWKCTKYTV